LPLVALLVKTSDFQTLAEELNAAFGPKGETPDFFEKTAGPEISHPWMSMCQRKD